MRQVDDVEGQYKLKVGMPHQIVGDAMNHFAVHGLGLPEYDENVHIRIGRSIAAGARPVQGGPYQVIAQRALKFGSQLVQQRCQFRWHKVDCSTLDVQ